MRTILRKAIANVLSDADCLIGACVLSKCIYLCPVGAMMRNYAKLLVIQYIDWHLKGTFCPSIVLYNILIHVPRALLLRSLLKFQKPM